MSDSDYAIRVVFRGVRGSYPVPGAGTLKYGGNTTCHEVLAGGHRIILDAGTGIIGLGSEIIREHIKTGEPVNACLFFSHVHHDHTFGLLYFKPVYFKSSHITIIGPKNFTGNIEDQLRDILSDPYHPVQLDEMGFKFDMIDVVGGECLRLVPGSEVPVVSKGGECGSPDDVIVKTSANCHHTKLGVLHYRIEHKGKSYVFATDVEASEEGEETLVEFARGADLIAHDAQYNDEEYYNGNPSKKGWGHSTIKMACATARLAGVKQLALIHHEPERDDAGL
ncbi:MAG: MBL fold metallo-hydrolase, partial [Planctomycetes bacterium]|nr:MBL fold metallo-hydrolase [Planctomycetota bacterium]